MHNSIFDLEHLQKTYFKLATPVVLGLVVTLIYNLADTYFIAATGNENLVAAVSLCSPIFTTLMAFGNIYGQGGSSSISRYLGQEDTDKVHHVSSFCFYIAIVTGLVIGLAMLLFKRPLLTLLGTDADTYGYAQDYYVILVTAAPIVILTFIHSNLLRCEGMAKESMFGSILGTVVNIILDPILISVFHMGAKGAAIATVIGYIVSDVFFFVVVKKKSHVLSVHPKEATLPLSDVQQIFGVGITAAITNLMQSACVIIMNQFLLPYGNDSIAAMGIVLKINMISQLVLTGFAFGSVPLIGYLYGANNREKLHELISFCLKFLGALSIVLTILLFIGAPTLIRAMMDSAVIVEKGIVMLRYQVISTVFVAIVLLMTCMFQAAGKVLPAFIMSISRQGIIFIPVMLLCVSLFEYQGFLMSQAIADMSSALIGIVMYKKLLA